jgi:hypothetical protein
MAQTASAPPAPAPQTSFSAALANLYFSPREAFQTLLVRPRFWIPLAGWLALTLVFTAVWVQKVDPHAYIKEQIEQSGRADKMTPEQMSSVVDTQAKMFPIFAWVGPFVFLPLSLLLIAGIYLFVFRFLFGGNMTFGQSAAILAWTFLAVGLVTTPLTLAVLWLKDEWNLDPRTALQANATLFLDRASTAKPLYSLLESLDLFSFWVLAVMAAGYGVANRKSTGWALWGVIAVWVVYVLGKAGLAAIF